MDPGAIAAAAVPPVLRTPTPRTRPPPGRAWVLAAFLPWAFGASEPAPLQQRLQEALGEPAATNTVWGAVVVRGDGSPIFSTNAHRAFIPASNTKLFIAALALDRLGPEARVVTPIRVERAPDSEGTLHSDLWIVGQGDPTVGFTPGNPKEGPGTTEGPAGRAATGDGIFAPWVTDW